MRQKISSCESCCVEPSDLNHSNGNNDDNDNRHNNNNKNNNNDDNNGNHNDSKVADASQKALQERS